ncbi:hypothetical protein SAMN04490240_1120 [Rhodococcus pyridinivorans]|uniref:hypothetical protein n=1 Tax=Rhodococcus pyridinivorans TaxID=103816 RepID=UPI0007CD403F|nr:hypothetical protein [Rhodococcus pyridinivorans]SEC10959.1 hypothetical protein SAMN04490240_1120 [Rhodococcus pyridinivorans]
MSVEDFRSLYERHVGHIVSGNMKAALADMVPENLPQVFDGVDTPRAEVRSHRIADVRAEGDLMIGEAVYELDDRTIGLRSYWEQRDGRWLAGRLENFDVEKDVRA